MKIILLLLLSGISLGCFSQRLSSFVSVGLGTSIEQNIEGCSNQNRSRIVGSMSAYYRVTDRISIGAEAMGSGALNIFGRTACDIVDPTDNSLKLSHSNLNAGTVLLRSKFQLITYKEMEPYIGVGVGINTYTYPSPVKDVERAKKSSFVFSPEIGVNMYKFQFSCKLILGGKTPAFGKMDTERNQMVTMQSMKAEQVYLTIGYQLFRF